MGTRPPGEGTSNLYEGIRGLSGRRQGTLHSWAAVRVTQSGGSAPGHTLSISKQPKAVPIHNDYRLSGHLGTLNE